MELNIGMIFWVGTAAEQARAINEVAATFSKIDARTVTSSLKEMVDSFKTRDLLTFCAKQFIKDLHNYLNEGEDNGKHNM